MCQWDGLAPRHRLSCHQDVCEAWSAPQYSQYSMQGPRGRMGTRLGPPHTEAFPPSRRQRGIHQSGSPIAQRLSPTLRVVVAAGRAMGSTAELPVLYIPSMCQTSGQTLHHWERKHHGWCDDEGHRCVGVKRIARLRQEPDPKQTRSPSLRVQRQARRGQAIVRLR